MAAPTPSNRIEERSGHASCVRADADLPPVAILGRSPITLRHKIFFVAVAVIGALAWTVVAFFRNEPVNAVWIVVAAGCTYIIGFRFYARLIEMKVVRPRDDHATPAEILDDGTDYVPTDRRVVFGHHFAAIAGAGPLVGPVLATQMGYLPSSIWIVVGAVLAGCVQDYLVLWISVRRRGRSLGQMVRDELGATAGVAALVGIPVIITIVIAVLALVVVRALAKSPWGVFSIATESFVAVIALLTAAILDQHLYFTLNAPSLHTHDSAATAAKYVNGLGLTGSPVTPDHISQAAASVGEQTIVSRTGGAPTLAFGMAEMLHRVVGGVGLKAFWYHFAIMFEALFILTTVDAGTRAARFMISDALGNFGGVLRKLQNPSWRPGAWACSLVVVAAWGSILLLGVTDPLGGINTLFPLFGIANQLLAGIALTVITVVVIKKGRLKWAWIPGIPLLWDLAVTLTASWQKIFSADPSVGYWTQHAHYAAAQHAGETAFGSATNADEINDVVRNTFVQGTLSIVFVVVVVLVVVAGVIVALKTIRGRGIPLAEDDPAPSTLFAPAGLIPTAAERKLQRRLGAPASASVAAPD